MPPVAVARADALIGAAIEQAVKLHHHRRLRRLGHPHVLDPPAGGGPFAAGDPPPRPGCRVEVLVDGAAACPRIAEAIAAARSHVHITGWHVAPHFELIRGAEPVVLGDLLARVAERVPVRVMVWAGAPLPVFHPTRKEVRADVQELVRGTAIQCQRDPREHPVHCHHEKTVIVDDEVAFVGGLDLTDLAGDRFDSSRHPARRRIGWHDVAVRLEGPVVADVERHFAMRWHEVAGERLPPPAYPPSSVPPSPSTVQVVRTVAEDMYNSVPHGDFRILEVYLRMIRGAQRFIYLENQFLWSPEIVAALLDKIRRPPSPGFRVVLVLPANANNGQDDTVGQLAVLVDADDGHERFLATTIRSHTGSREDPLYVHAKVGIVDDRWLTIGSANLNGHSLFNDTEMNIVTDDAALARHTRLRLWAEHLEAAPEELDAADPVQVVDERWRPLAMEQLRRRRTGEPPSHRLVALPGVSKRSRRLLGPLQELLEDG